MWNTSNAVWKKQYWNIDKHHATSQVWLELSPAENTSQVWLQLSLSDIYRSILSTKHCTEKQPKKKKKQTIFMTKHSALFCSIYCSMLFPEWSVLPCIKVCCWFQKYYGCIHNVADVLPKQTSADIKHGPRTQLLLDLRVGETQHKTWEPPSPLKQLQQKTGRPHAVACSAYA